MLNQHSAVPVVRQECLSEAQKQTLLKKVFQYEWGTRGAKNVAGHRWRLGIGDYGFKVKTKDPAKAACVICKHISNLKIV